jgi:hypothetical protein
MGLVRKIGGIGLAALGAVTGIGPLIAAGTAISATSGVGDKPKGGGGGAASVPSVSHAANLAPGPPMSASSLDVARGQDKSRMKRQYGL